MPPGRVPGTIFIEEFLKEKRNTAVSGERLPLEGEENQRLEEKMSVFSSGRGKLTAPLLFTG